MDCRFWSELGTEIMNGGDMMKMSNTYALLVSIGNYGELDKEDLPCYAGDLQTMEYALTAGLKLAPDNLRILGKNGCVRTMTFARAMAEFGALLQSEDVFIFYFSGHGQKKELLFSDGAVTVQSIVDYIDRLQAKSKIVILDCCYSGGVKISSEIDFSFEESIAAFSGRGMAVMASSAADKGSWLVEGGRRSLYTEFVATSILSRRNIRAGRISLSDINAETRYLMQEWNKAHPEKREQPIYRDGMLGTIFFQVEEYHPYVMQKLTMETRDYFLKSVKPLHTGKYKRYAAFVILKANDDSLIPEITKDIVHQIKQADIYSSIQMDQRHRGRTADAIWCYFGHNEGDLIRSNHCAYTIWANSKEAQDLYFRENSNAEVIDNIYIFWNSSYGIVKELQKTDTPDEKVIADYQALSNQLIGKAEEFRRALNEVENRVLNYEEFQREYQGWIQNVRTLYFKLSDVPPAPLASSRWSEAVMNLAGWVVDLAVLLELKSYWEDPGECWIILQTIRRYEQALETLGRIERISTSIKTEREDVPD